MIAGMLGGDKDAGKDEGEHTLFVAKPVPYFDVVWLTKLTDGIPYEKVVEMHKAAEKHANSVMQRSLSHGIDKDLITGKPITTAAQLFKRMQYAFSANSEGFATTSTKKQVAWDKAYAQFLRQEIQAGKFRVEDYLGERAIGVVVLGAAYWYFKRKK